MEDRKHQNSTQKDRTPHARIELIPFEVVGAEGKKEVFMTPARGTFVRREQRIQAVKKTGKVVGHFVGKYGKMTLVAIGMGAVFILAIVFEFVRSFAVTTTAPTPTRKVPFDDWKKDADKKDATQTNNSQINIVNNKGTVNVHQHFNNK